MYQKKEEDLLRYIFFLFREVLEWRNDFVPGPIRLVKYMYEYSK